VTAERPPRQPGGWWVTGVPAGRIFGVPIYVAPSWFFVAVLITIALGPPIGDRVPNLRSGWEYAVAALFVVLLYASVLVHELSHSLVARTLGLPVRRIQLQLVGGVSEIGQEAADPGTDYLVAIAGPLTSVLLGGLARVAELNLRPHTIPEVVALYLAAVNGIVAAFNLLPGLPLDGGRVLRAALWRIRHDRLAATTAAAWAGRGVAVAIPVLAIGLPGETSPTSPATNAYFLYALYLALVLWVGATGSLREARLSVVLPKLRLRQLARRALTVRADLPLAEAVRQAQEAGARAVVIVDGHGRPESVVSEGAVMAVPEAKRPWMEVAQLARPVEEGMVLNLNMSGRQVLDAMHRNPASEYLVVDDRGELFGVLTQADVAAALQAR
jgi:Zn-dependent protease/CBS domain-containing protein